MSLHHTSPQNREAQNNSLRRLLDLWSGWALIRADLLLEGLVTKALSAGGPTGQEARTPPTSGASVPAVGWPAFSV